MPEMIIDRRTLVRDGEATRVMVGSASGNYTCFEREVEGNHMSTPESELIEMVQLIVYKDTFQKYALKDAIEQSDKTAEQVKELNDIIEQQRSTLAAQESQLKDAEKVVAESRQQLTKMTLRLAGSEAGLAEHHEVIIGIAKKIGYTLPEDFEEEYEEDTEGEEHESTNETSPVGDKEANNHLEGGESHEEGK